MFQTLVLILTLFSFHIVESKNVEPIEQVLNPLSIGSGITTFPSLMCEYHNLQNYLHIPNPKQTFTSSFMLGSGFGKIRICKPWTTIPTTTTPRVPSQPTTLMTTTKITTKKLITTPTPKVPNQPKTKEMMCKFHFSSLICILMNSAKILVTTTSATSTATTTITTLTTATTTTTTNYSCKYHNLPKKWWKWSPFKATLRHTMVCKYVKQRRPSKTIPTTIKTIPKENNICKVMVYTLYWRVTYLCF